MGSFLLLFSSFLSLLLLSNSTPIITSTSTPSPTPTPLPGCQTFHDNQCSGSVIITPPDFEARRWFTPLKGDPDYLPSFQDYGLISGNSHVVYSSDRKSAVVTLVANRKNNSTLLRYLFDGQPQSTPTRTYTTAYTGTLSVGLQGSDGSSIVLEPVDFAWNAPAVAGDGQKGSVVEFFGWPHEEVEKECAFLAKAGYLGAKLFPPQEQVMSLQPFNNILNPWYFMYQPTSYRLGGRMGTRDQLRQLIRTCRSMGVRVYADAVVNHMTGSGNDANPRHRNANGGSCTTWGAKNTSLNGGPSPYYTQGFTYTYGTHTNQPPCQEFPAANYGPTDFHCERALNSWNDPLDLNAGWLTGLVDLNTEKDNVRERIADYFTDLISIGFSGFRIDAAKHIHPDDLIAIFSKFKRNMGGALPDDFISWLEVLLGGESDLLMCNPSSGYNFGKYLEDGLLAAGFTQTDVNKIKIWNSGYPKEPEKGFCTISRVRNAIQNDDADQQNPGSTSRDMGDQGCVLIRGCDTNTHRNFELKLFQSPNGASDNAHDYPIRLILSSFYFPSDSAMGIPDGLSDCSLCKVTCNGCQTVPYKEAFNGNSKGYDGKVGQVDYTRVHRDSQIINAMRSWMGMSQLEEGELIGQEEGKVVDSQKGNRVKITKN